MTVNNNKGKMGPVYIHPMIPQGGRPGTGDPPASRVDTGMGGQGKGTSGRKTWPGKKPAAN